MDMLHLTLYQNIIEETITGGIQSNLDGYNPLNQKYSFIKFTPPPGEDIKFIQGDPVVYQPSGESLVGLDTGRTYYVDPVIPGPNQNVSKIRLYNSNAQIGTASTVQVGPTTSTTDTHSFVLQRHASRVLEADNVLKKIYFQNALKMFPSIDKSLFN